MRIITGIAVVLSYIASILVSVCLIVLCISFLKDIYGNTIKVFFTDWKSKLARSVSFNHHEVAQ